MRKNISTQELKIHIGEIIDSVRLRGDRFIIERRGKAVAALVPLSVHENDERDRSRFFEMIENIHRKNRNLPAAEIDKAVSQAIADVHREKRGKNPRS